MNYLHVRQECKTSEEMCILITAEFANLRIRKFNNLNLKTRDLEKFRIDFED